VQYLADFTRETSGIEKYRLPNIPLDEAICKLSESETKTQQEHSAAIIALQQKYPTQYESGAFFGQNPLTLLSKACEVEWDPYASTPEDATLWGTVIAYLPIFLKGEKTLKWTFYVLLSADYERGEYENRKLGVAFSLPVHSDWGSNSGAWGYLPDPHVALALASCVGWQKLCVVHGTCTMNAINHSHEDFAPSELAELPPYVQREDCEKCRPPILP
jgi:hypothetical protein